MDIKLGIISHTKIIINIKDGKRKLLLFHAPAVNLSRFQHNENIKTAVVKIILFIKY